ANKPHRFKQVFESKYAVLIIPRHTSENRDYLPTDIFSSDTICSDSAMAIYDPPLWCLSVLSSKLHMAWIATVCGKIKTDFRYSNTLGWNTFPVPTLTEQNKVDLTRCAEDILFAREAHFPATIADLYDPKDMPDNLRRAHDANDEMLERIYIGRRFKNDTERLEKLFELYTKMTKPKEAA
ncbi:MAG: type IIL restriction-modification enzyme MmeI, partial [Usitatibacteraceae bacterium]